MLSRKIPRISVSEISFHLFGKIRKTNSSYQWGMGQSRRTNSPSNHGLQNLPNNLNHLARPSFEIVVILLHPLRA